MPVFRWLLLGLLGWLMYRLWRQFKAINTTLNEAGSQSPYQTPSVEPMVKCAHCELHIPQQHAVTDHTHWFCCTQHKDAYTQP